MERTHQDKWLITWDTLARQAAKKSGRHEPIRIIRPRTIIYLAVLLIAMIGMTTALLTRSTLGLSVQRDRAPVFVPLADGSLRNGYTVKIANKTQIHAAFDLTVDGLPDATLVVAEGDPKPVSVLRLLSASDEVDTFRVLVTARPVCFDGRLATDRLCSARHRDGRTDRLPLDIHGSAGLRGSEGKMNTTYGAGFPLDDRLDGAGIHGQRLHGL